MTPATSLTSGRFAYYKLLILCFGKPHAGGPASYLLLLGMFAPRKAGYRRALWEVRNVSIWVF